MSSTYLDLTNIVLRRLNQVELTPSSFASARGIHSAAKDAIIDSVRKINTQKFKWPFNFTSGTQILVPGQESYPFPTDFRSADWESFFIQKDSVYYTTRKLSQISKNEYYRYRKSQDDNESLGRDIPDFVFELDALNFGVTPSPNLAYTLNYRYQLKNTEMSDFGDTCLIPNEYDYVIVDGAMYYMYMFLDNDQRAIATEKMFLDDLNYMTTILIPRDPYAYTGMIQKRDPYAR